MHGEKAPRYVIGDIVEEEDWPLTRSLLGDHGSPALTGPSAVQSSWSMMGGR